MDKKQKLGTALVFLSGYLVGERVQSTITKRRLRRGIDRAFANCETAQDIVAVENVLDSFIEANTP